MILTPWIFQSTGSCSCLSLIRLAFLRACPTLADFGAGALQGGLTRVDFDIS
jgi:hypothetical protein